MFILLNNKCLVLPRIKAANCHIWKTCPHYICRSWRTYQFSFQQLISRLSQLYFYPVWYFKNSPVCKALFQPTYCCYFCLIFSFNTSVCMRGRTPMAKRKRKWNLVSLTLVPHIHRWVEVACCSRSTGTRPSVCPASPESSPAVIQSPTAGVLSAADAAPQRELLTPRHTLSTSLEGYHLLP